MMHLCRALARTLFAAGFLVGCGNNPNPKPYREKRDDGTPWKVFYGVLTEEIRSLDPQVGYDEVSRRALEPVQDPLLDYEIMATSPYKVGPCILESVPQPVHNADGTVTYHCAMKPGIFYHDDPCFPGGKGREVVASDVQYVFQRLCDPSLQSPFFSNLADYVDGMQDAFDTAKKAGGKLDYDTMKVRGIEVLDAHHFDLKLSRAYPQITYWLAYPCTDPVAREAVEYYDGQAHADGPHGEMEVRPLFAFHPVGDGAFIMKEWVRGQRFRYVRNEHYTTMVFPSSGWPPEREAVCRPLAGKPLPLVDELELTVFREILPQFLLARQGYLDRFAVQKDAVNSIVTATQELSQKWKARGMKLGTNLWVSTFYLSFNMQDPLLGGNKKLRQALSCSYNAQGFIDLLYGGVAPVAQQLLSPGVFGFDPNFRNPYGFNVEKAKQLMVEAGYPDGHDPKTGQPLEITLDVAAGGSEERQLAEYTQRQLEQTGMRVKVVENTFARMLEKEDQGNYQVCSGTGWGADYPDPENYFFLFYSKNFPPEGKNIDRYKNPEFDALFEKMATMEDSPERLALTKKMNDILIEDTPIILEFNKGGYYVEQPWAPVTHKNMLLEGGYKYLPVDVEMRAQKQREWNPVPKWPIALGLAAVIAGLGYGAALNRKRNV
jgi:ABC-type transport system substrate-binding protein